MSTLSKMGMIGLVIVLLVLSLLAACCSSDDEELVTMDQLGERGFPSM